MPRKVDVHRTDSDKAGFAGFIEVFLRKFKTISFLIFLTPIICLMLACLGLAVFPGALLLKFVYNWGTQYSDIVHTLLIALSVPVAYFFYGVTLIFVLPAVNFILPLRIKPWRGNWRSVQTVPWYIHNSLVYMARYTFLNMITPSPLTNLFYKLMGMKIGKGVLINTTNISDPNLITLEDYVTIGGSATLLAHYGQKGYLVLAPLVIKKGANIGLKASLMGDVVIGENAVVKPHAAVLPKTRVGEGEVYG